MKKTILTILGTLILFSLFAQEIPQKISYQGKLLENGEPVNGTKNITFTIDTWFETQNVTISNGIYSVKLGEITPIPVSLFTNNSTASLQISVEVTNLNPQTEIVSVAYAFKAEKAVSAENVPTNISELINDIGFITDPNDEDADATNELQNLSLSGSNLSISNGNTVVLPSSGSSIWTQNGNNIYYNTGKVGIGSSINSPQFTLHVVDEQTSLKLGVAHFMNTAIAVDAAGISASCVNTDFYGYGGYFTGGYCGVEGKVSTVSGTNNGYVGVLGLAENEGGNASIYGVYGKTNGGDADSYAGYFLGNVHVQGTLSKSSGSFKIDHPLDPKNKYLYHSFVESPDMMNVYNGNVILDDKGEATVKLPDYFEVLNMEFRYQLTCIGGFAPVYVAEKIKGNIFKIAGGKSGLEISWQVTGIRKDPYAIENRIQVEVEKSDKEKGHYLHYKEYNQPIEKSVESVNDPGVLKKGNKEKK